MGKVREYAYLMTVAVHVVVVMIGRRGETEKPVVDSLLVGTVSPHRQCERAREFERVIELKYLAVILMTSSIFGIESRKLDII